MGQLKTDPDHLNALHLELEPACQIEAEAGSIYQHHCALKLQFFHQHEFLNGELLNLVSGLLLHIGTRHFLIHSRHLKQPCVPDVNGQPDQSGVA
ncbi:hypothetical protein D3C80_1239270 [compost metagenome]